VPTNVTITTKTGPVTLTLRASDTLGGFTLVGNNAGIRPATGAALTINGAASPGPGIVVTTTAANSTVSLGNITVANTGDDGIQVTRGTANILAGVSVTGAGASGVSISGGAAHIDAGITVTGTAVNGLDISGGAVTLGGGVTVTGATSNGINLSGGTVAINAGVNVTTSGTNGLNISGGTATITVTANQASTAFDSNTRYGIAVSGPGVLNISGAAPASGTAVRTVSAKSNTNDNIYFASTATTTSTIDGLYSYNSTAGDGLQIFAGSRITVRNSVFRRNAGNGIHISSVTGSATSVLTNIDLGSTGDFGNNVLQSATTANQNAGAGICVSLTTGSTAQALTAMGNQFTGVNCATATPGPIVKNATCTAAADLGIILSTGPAVTVDTSNCTHTP
jgi:hypothetical protein